MDVFGQIWDWLCNLCNNALDWLIGLLPDSPFSLLDNTPIKDMLPYINWFIPVPFIVDVLSLWLVSISIYYMYSAYLRWVKALD